MNKFGLIVIAIAILSATILITGAILELDTEDNRIETKCFDRNSNEIIGSVCIENTIEVPTVMYLSGFFGLMVSLGLVIFFQEYIYE